MKLWSVILVAMLSVVHLDADARRMGGGKSIGKQSSNVTQREAAPPAAPAAPMQQNAANSAAPKPAALTRAQKDDRRRSRQRIAAQGIGLSAQIASLSSSISGARPA